MILTWLTTRYLTRDGLIQLVHDDDDKTHSNSVPIGRTSVIQLPCLALPRQAKPRLASPRQAVPRPALPSRATPGLAAPRQA
jgi:hypothetical protein